MTETKVFAHRIDLSATTTPTLGLFPGFLWFNSSSNKLFIYNGTIFREYAESAEVTSAIGALTGTDIAITDNFNFSNATNVQGVLDDVETNIYQEFLDEHNADGTHGPKVTIDQTSNDNALTVNQTTAATANVINVTNAGTGNAISVAQNGAGIALNINKTNVGVGNIIDITNAGTGRDIDGNASNWFVTSAGAGTFTSLDAGSGAVSGGAGTFTSLNAGSGAVSGGAGTFTSLDAGSGAVDGGTATFTNLNSTGKRNIGTATELTISAGSITVTQGHHTVDTEGDAASDNLDNIVGGVEGDLLILCAENDARTISIRNNQGTGTSNIFVRSGQSPRNLNTVNDTILLLHNGSNWVEISHSNNS